MEMDGLDEVYRLHRFVPTREEAVGYFLRRLLTGDTIHGAEKLIRHAEVYACEPKELARQFAPVPTAVSSGDRFFFTTCRRGKNGRCKRAAGDGTWTVQKTEDVYDDEGVKIGEVSNLSFKKGKGKDKLSTGWVMEEYRCLMPQAIVADGEKVLCRIHLAPNAPAAARQESNAYRLRRQEGAEAAPAPQPAEPVTVMASAHAQKRPAPVAADDDMSSCKKMRIAAPVPVPEPEVEYEDCPTWFTPAAPVSTLPAASTEVPEADDDTGRLSCSWEDIFGEQQQEEQTLPVEDAESIIDQLVSDEAIDQFLDSLRVDDWEAEVQEEEQQTTLPIQAQNNLQRHQEEEELVSDEDIDIGQIVASFLADFPEEEEAELQKTSCNHNDTAADLHTPWMEQFISFAAVQ